MYRRAQNVYSQDLAALIRDGVVIDGLFVFFQHPCINESGFEYVLTYFVISAMIIYFLKLVDNFSRGSLAEEPDMSFTHVSKRSNNYRSVRRVQ